MSDMTEEQKGELLRLLKAEDSRSSHYAESEVIANQLEALRRYFGQPYGDEAVGRSQVVTRELFEIIEWVRPELVRIFAQSGRVVHIEESQPEDAMWADAAADYLNFIFMQDNPGGEIIDTMVFDGLLARNGVAAAYWRKEDYDAPVTITGLNILQLEELQADPRHYVLDAWAEAEAADEGHPDGVFYSAKVQKVARCARVEIVNVAPEDFRISTRAVDIEEARYCGRLIRTTRGEAARDWPDMAMQILEGGGRSWEWQSEERREARLQDSESSLDDRGGDGPAEDVIVMEEYIRADIDGDGYPELVRAYRLGDMILEAGPVDETPFAVWSPIRVPHRFWGLSMHDIASDIQRVKTVSTRVALDAMLQSVHVREFIDETRVNLDDVVDPSVGVKVRVNGPPGPAVMTVMQPNVAPAALQMIEYVDQVLEARTGVTRNAQGLDPDALNKTATGIQLMQNAASLRKENIARNFALGLEALMRKVYRLVCRNQDVPRQVKIAGQWAQISPVDWDADARVRINVGIGTGSPQQQLAVIQQIQQMQAAVVQQMGLQNPMTGLTELWNSADEFCRVANYRSAERFFKKPDPNWQPPPPPPDPAVQKAQIEMQMRQMESQQRAQEQAAKEAQAQAAALQKMQIELQLGREKIQAEMALAREKMQAEFTLRREQMALEAQLSVAAPASPVNQTPVRMGGAVG